MIPLALSTRQYLQEGEINSCSNNYLTIIETHQCTDPLHTLTIASPPISVESVANPTAASVRADVVMAIMLALIRTLGTLVNICVGGRGVCE